MKFVTLAVATAAAATLCAGCASVVESTKQPIAVNTAPEVGANCEVSNDRGKWSLVTPGSVTVEKSVSALMIVCAKPGYKDGKAYAASTMSSTAMIGMMLPYVGMLNAAVDGSSGAAQKYPSAFTITMTPTAAAAAPANTAASAPAPAAPPAVATNP